MKGQRMLPSLWYRKSVVRKFPLAPSQERVIWICDGTIVKTGVTDIHPAKRKKTWYKSADFLSFIEAYLAWDGDISQTVTEYGWHSVTLIECFLLSIFHVKYALITFCCLKFSSTEAKVRDCVLSVPV